MNPKQRHRDDLPRTAAAGFAAGVAPTDGGSVAINPDELIISAVRNCRHTKTHDMTLAGAISEIQSGKHADAVREIRRLCQANRRKDADALKRELPGIMFAGTFDRRRNDALRDHSGLLCLDFDDTGPEIKHDLANDPHAVLTFVSPSGHGVKCVVAIEPATGADEHGASFNEARKHFADRYQLDADPSGCDLARLCFVSWDPEPAVNITPGMLCRPYMTRETIQTIQTIQAMNGDAAAEAVSDCDTSIPDSLYGLCNIDQIIQATLPRQPGQRHRQVFALARGLRFDAGLGDKPLRELKPIVQRWHEIAKPRITTQAFDDTWIDFVHAWPRVQKPLSETAISTAWDAVESGELPPEAESYDKPEIKKLVALCWRLAGDSGEFYLAMQKAADLLEVKYAIQIKRWLAMLQADELIEIVKPGTRHTATTYRWKGKP